MLLKSQSMSCLLDAETPVKHQRSPSHGATIIGKAEIVGAGEYHSSLEQFPFVMKRQERESMDYDQDRTPPPTLWSRNTRMSRDALECETLESINQELRRRCHELSLQIQALEEESSLDQRYCHVNLHALQCERDTLKNDKHRLLRDCNILEQKVIAINFHNEFTSEI